MTTCSVCHNKTRLTPCRSCNVGIIRQAELNVFKVRGSWDAPGFEACVKEEFNRLRKLHNAYKDE